MTSGELDMNIPNFSLSAWTKLTIWPSLKLPLL